MFINKKYSFPSMGKKGDRKVVTRLIKQLARKMISETELEEVSF